MPVLRLIAENPFRVFGVYANAKPAEIVSNCDDMEAYLSIGRSVSFDLDLNNIITKVERTEASVANARKQINLPKDKLKYAMFWFVRDSSSNHVLNYLKNGDFDNVYDVLDIEDSFASKINKAITEMLQHNLGTAIANVSEMIHDNDNIGLRNDFVKTICGDAFLITEEELSHLYIDTLLEEVDASDLFELFVENGVSEDDNAYLKRKAIDEPISKINAEIAKVKAVNRDDASANLRAGETLMKNTKTDLAKVKVLLGKNDLKYQMVSDDLANTILQCGINYYNNIDDCDIDKVIKLQKYACKIAIGKRCKDRCDKNLDILQKKKKELPPAVVKEYDTAIKTCILNRIVLGGQNIDNAVAMMKECAPHIVAIKEHPEFREYYLNISTQVVNAALSSVIEEYNTMSEKLSSNLGSAMRRDSAIMTLREMLKKAWSATLMMDKFDKEEEFKNGRYKENRQSLYEVIESSEVYVSRGIFGYKLNNIPSEISNEELDLRTEEEVWNECRVLSDYMYYLNRYPNAKYKTVAKNRYDMLYAAEEKRKEEERQARWEREVEEKEFNNCVSISDYEDYLRKYPNGRHKTEATNKIVDIRNGISNTIRWVSVFGGLLVGGLSESFIVGVLVCGIGFLIGFVYNKS